MSQGDLSKILRSVRDISSFTDGLWRRLPKKKTVSCVISWRETGLSQHPGSGWSWWINRCIFVYMAHRILEVVEYRSNHQDKCIKLTPDLRILIHRHLTWNHQRWSHVIFADESRLTSTTLNINVSLAASLPSAKRSRRRFSSISVTLVIGQ